MEKKISLQKKMLEKLKITTAEQNKGKINEKN